MHHRFLDCLRQSLSDIGQILSFWSITTAHVALVDILDQKWLIVSEYVLITGQIWNVKQKGFQVIEINGLDTLKMYWEQSLIKRKWCLIIMQYVSRNIVLSTSLIDLVVTDLLKGRNFLTLVVDVGIVQNYHHLVCIQFSKGLFIILGSVVEGESAIVADVPNINTGTKLVCKLFP